MSMIIPDTRSTKNETSLQRRARQRREGLERGRVKSKAQLAAESAAARDAGLETSLDQSNKGFAMLKKLGFKGGALGKRDRDDGAGAGAGAGLTQPLNPVFKEDRGGIGLDAERKRQAREALEREPKKAKAKASEGDYRDHVRREAEVQRLEAKVLAAQKVAERLQDNNAESATGRGDADADGAVDSAEAKKPSSAKVPLQSINVLWREIVKKQREKERNL